MDGVFYGFAVLIFAAAILLAEGAYLWWGDTHGGARRIARRLRLMSDLPRTASERISILKQRRYSQSDALDRLLHKLTLARAIDKLLQQAGVQWSVAHFIASSVGMLAAGALLAQLWPLVPLPVRGLLALLFMGIPYALLRRERTLRLRKIELQLPEAADFLARALRAGHSFNNVLQMVGTELAEPLSGEFRTAHEEINYGVPMHDALTNMANRVPLTDLRYLVIAVLIQREAGGNLAEILGNISQLIRARLKLIAQVRVLSAEGRMSAWVLGLLPFALLLTMSVTSPSYISILWTDPVGVRVLWYGAGMLLLGVVWLRKLIRIRI